MEINIDKNFTEQSYQISNDIYLIIEEFTTYLDINQTFYPISSLTKNMKEFEDHIEISNGYEVAKIPNKCLDIINDIITK